MLMFFQIGGQEDEKAQSIETAVNSGSDNCYDRCNCSGCKRSKQFNKNDADYKYSKTLEDGTVVSFTRDLINEPVATEYIQCKIQLREGDEFGNYPFFGLTYSKRLPNQEWDKNGTVAYGVLNIKGSNLKQGTYSLTCNGDG